MFRRVFWQYLRTSVFFFPACFLALSNNCLCFGIILERIIIVVHDSADQNVELRQIQNIVFCDFSVSESIIFIACLGGYALQRTQATTKCTLT